MPLLKALAIGSELAKLLQEGAPELIRLLLLPAALFAIEVGAEVEFGVEIDVMP